MPMSAAGRVRDDLGHRAVRGDPVDGVGADARNQQGTVPRDDHAVELALRQLGQGREAPVLADDGDDVRADRGQDQALRRLDDAVRERQRVALGDGLPLAVGVEAVDGGGAGGG